LGEGAGVLGEGRVGGVTQHALEKLEMIKVRVGNPPVAETTEDTTEDVLSSHSEMILMETQNMEEERKPTQRTQNVVRTSWWTRWLRRHTHRKQGKQPEPEVSGSVNVDTSSAIPELKIPDPQDAVCSICLESYEDEEVVRRLPCKHLFHSHCVDTWLRVNASCPLCKQNVNSGLRESRRRRRSTTTRTSGGRGSESATT